MGENGTLKAYDSANTTALRFGLGFEYVPVKLNGFAFRLAYEGDYFSVTDVNPNNLSYISDTYGQSFSALYIGASYKF